jgi:CheY-like chemotaxis protein
MRILIAEDDPTARELARHILTHAGHQVDAVADGDAALEALLRGQYGLALLDLQLPGMDGHEVARAARAALPVCPRLIAFSAAADTHDAPRYRALGFDGCLGKPIRAADLRHVLDAGHGLEPPPPPLGAPPALPPAPCAAAARAFFAAAHADRSARAAAARALKGAALDADQPLLAGLCARFERALLAADEPAAAELTAAIAAQFPAL